MSEITPEQNAQLSAWAAQRDAALLEISRLQEEKNVLEKVNREVAESTSELEQRAVLIEGRIQELNKKEQEFSTLVSAENAALRSEKSGLQSDVSNLRGEIVVLQTQKNTIKDMVVTLTDVYDRVFDRAKVLDEVVDHVTSVSKANVREVEMLLGTLRSSVQGVLDVNADNIEKTNQVISEIPRAMFMLLKKEPLQRDISPRRTI